MLQKLQNEVELMKKNFFLYGTLLQGPPGGILAAGHQERGCLIRT